MDEIEEKILRDFLDDLVASKGTTRKLITENIVTFVKKCVAQQGVNPTTKGVAHCKHGVPETMVCRQCDNM